MRIQHGGLTIDVPETWSDRSSLLFTAPTPPVSLPATASVQVPMEAISVNFWRHTGQTPKEVLEEQAGALRESAVDFEVLSEGPFTCGLGDGWRYTQRLTLGDVPVKQLAIACRAGAMMLIATAAAVESRFDRCESELHSVLASLRAVETTGFG